MTCKSRDILCLTHVASETGMCMRLNFSWYLWMRSHWRLAETCLWIAVSEWTSIRVHHVVFLYTDFYIFSTAYKTANTCNSNSSDMVMDWLGCTITSCVEITGYFYPHNFCKAGSVHCAIFKAIVNWLCRYCKLTS